MSVSLLQVPAMALANGGGGAGPSPPSPSGNPMNYMGVWAAGTAYAAESVVLGSNGSQYLALVASTGVDPVTSIASGQSSVSWVRLAADSLVAPNYSATTQYGVGDLLISNSIDSVPTLWQCIAPTINTVPVPGNPAFRRIADAVGASMNYLGPWSGADAAVSTYDLNDVVSYLGVAWVSLTNTNFNNAPAFPQTTHWAPLAGPGSVPQVRYRNQSQVVGGFSLPAIAVGGFGTVLTLPNTAQAGEFGTFTLNFTGITATAGAVGIPGMRFFISDVLNGAASAALVFDTKQFIAWGLAAGVSSLFNAGPFTIILSYAFTNAPATLYLNCDITGGGDTVAYAAAQSTGYSYINESYPAQLIADP